MMIAGYISFGAAAKLGSSSDQARIKF